MNLMREAEEAEAAFKVYKAKMKYVCNFSGLGSFFPSPLFILLHLCYF